MDGEALWGDPVALERDTLLDVDYGISANAFLQKDGGIIVLWNSAIETTERIKMQHLDDTGVLITPYVVDTSHIMWDVSMHSDGSVVPIFTNWYTAYPPAGDAYIANILYAFRIDPQGSLIWNPGIITVSDTMTYKFDISISEYTNGEWIATWSDGRSTPSLEEKCAGIFAQNIRQDGTLGPLFIPGPGKGQPKEITVYPNPFNSKATITFVPSSAGEVILTLYNSSGLRVRSVLLGRYSEGTHSVILNREGLAPGIYLLNIANGRWQATEKLMVY
ncbi:MAG: T9SS type A sorting domain-containing protein [Bacteroidetes bacterium]|nr:T9SS type A sorting domain-containing protein [Bacteroidota bacterium]